MLTVYSPRHRLHQVKVELVFGEVVPCFEKPERADLVLDRVKAVGLGDVIEPRAYGAGPLQRVHRADYLDFLAGAWDEWTALGRSHDAMPFVWPVPTLRSDVVPRHIDGKLGHYSMDASVAITAGTWEAARDAADVALTAAEAVRGGQRAAFALCRPPGHHATAAMMGGYCYLNNAAIAVQHLRDQGAEHIGVLDVDYHHGNGTQDLFYARSDVFFASLHGDPAVEFPYFSGYADETGSGDGLGFNLNLPLPHGTAWSGYVDALDRACARIAAHGPDVLVVSLGVDTFERDPISRFKLASDDYLRLGRRIAALGKPTLFVFEGGYAVDDIGVNAVNVLQGFEGA